jgi:hypothetical protein
VSPKLPEYVDAILISSRMETFGADMVRIRPVAFSDFMISCNILPFVLLVVGGSLVSIGNHDGGSFGPGSHPPLQASVSDSRSFALSVEFACKVDKTGVFIEHPTESIRPRKRFRYFFAVLIFAFLCILLRCIYEIVTLASGWGAQSQMTSSDFLSSQICEALILKSGMASLGA